jgi:hypothetical protein
MIAFDVYLNGEKLCASEVVVVLSRWPSMAICRAAERFGVDLICFGSLGRSGLSRAILGFVAQDVMAQLASGAGRAREKGIKCNVHAPDRIVTSKMNATVSYRKNDIPR